ncbi:MAG: hypothetical protein JNJ40_05320 [Bacteroidia bacterium]|nr:hypothetical protein [Bacteroidia bacterium]
MKTLLYTSFLILNLVSKAQDIGTSLSGASLYSSSSNKEFERAASTIAFSTVNIAMNAGNIIHLNNKKKKSNAGFGVVTGLAQIANGVIFNEKEEDLKAIDVSVGTATVIFSSIRLLKKQKQAKEEKLSLAPAFLSAPFYGKITALALRLKF